MLLPLATTAFGGAEGYFSLAIVAFEVFEFIVLKYSDWLGNMDNKRSPDSYMREIDTIWQTGVLAGKPCTKWNIPSSCLDASKDLRNFGECLMSPLVQSSLGGSFGPKKELALPPPPRLTSSLRLYTP